MKMTYPSLSVGIVMNNDVEVSICSTFIRGQCDGELETVDDGDEDFPIACLGDELVDDVFDCSLINVDTLESASITEVDSGD